MTVSPFTGSTLSPFESWTVSLTGLLFCLGPSTGYFFSRPHVTHVTTNMSAQGLRPPRLSLRTSYVAVLPGMSSVSQCLQSVLFKAGPSRICVFSDTARRSVVRRRERLLAEEEGLVVGAWESEGVGVLGEDVLCSERYAAAW